MAIQHDGDLSRIEDNTRLNSLVSHELMTVNEKFKSTYANRFKCFLFMGTNKPVKITDAKSGLIRRLIDVSPSGNKLSPKEYKAVTKQIEFELGAIAYHCQEVYVSGNKLTGTMKNNGAVTKKITTRDEEVTIPQGFHDGSGKVGIDATEKGKLIANNIREGVTILGVEGTMSGSENMKPQAKTVTPSTAKQTILPDTEYNCLSQVEVEAIPYVEADNPAGGVTVTIAG